MAEGVDQTCRPRSSSSGPTRRASADDRDGAREAFERALAPGLLELPRGPTWTITLTWAADICAWLEDRSTAARLLELLAPFADVMTWQYGPVGRGVGLLDLALGRRDEAERRLREAVALCERMDARAFLAMARHDLGTLLLPSAEGRRLLEQARAAADELGMPGLTKRAVAAYGIASAPDEPDCSSRERERIAQ